MKRFVDTPEIEVTEKRGENLVGGVSPKVGC